MLKYVAFFNMGVPCLHEYKQDADTGKWTRTLPPPGPGMNSFVFYDESALLPLADAKALLAKQTQEIIDENLAYLTKMQADEFIIE